MSMSLRLRASGHRFAARADEDAVDVEEEVLAGAVVRRGPDAGERDRIERLAQRAGVGAADDVALAQHHEMRVMDRDQRRQE